MLSKTDPVLTESPIMEAVENNNFPSGFMHSYTLVIQHLLQAFLEIANGLHLWIPVQVRAGEAEMRVYVFVTMSRAQIVELAPPQPV